MRETLLRELARHITHVDNNRFLYEFYEKCSRIDGTSELRVQQYQEFLTRIGPRLRYHEEQVALLTELVQRIALPRKETP